MKSPKYPIDFVVLWVDGSDSKWLKKKQQYQPDIDIADTAARYRDWGTFKYWFRGVEKYAPWVNHIYLVTDNQKPDWLNADHPKLTIVDHKDIIDKKYLPTFNSQAIEMNLHKIPNLSERFVYFNDDTFLINPVKPTDFFKHGLPAEIANINAATGMEGDQLFAQTMFNDILLINRHFDKRKIIKQHPLKWLNPKYGTFNIRTLSQIIYPYFTGYRPQHLPAPFLKSTFNELWREESDILEATSSHRFRHKDDINQHAFIQWQLCKNQFVPRKKSSGRYIKLNDNNIREVEKVIRSHRLKTICINDGVSNSIEKTEYLQIRRRLAETFEEKLPNPSSFEKKQPLKILHVLDVKQASGNGVAEAVRQYAEQESRLADVALWCIDDIITPRNIRVYDKSYQTITPILNEERPDIVIFNELYKKKYLSAYKNCIQNNVPYIVIPHGSLTNEAQKKKKTKKIISNLLLFDNFIKKAGAIQFLNDSEKNESKTPKNRHIIIHGNGVEGITPGKRRGKKDNNIVFIGRYSIHQKGIDLLIDAATEIHDFLKKKNIRINLYGRDSTDTMRAVLKLIEQKKVTDIITVNKPVYGKEKNIILKNASYFILTSRYEGEPMGVVEALSYGIPCIVTNQTSFGNIVESYNCGTSADANKTQIANAIVKIINIADYSEYSRNALKLVKEKYTWQNVIGGTIKDYERIAKRKEEQ